MRKQILALLLIVVGLVSLAYAVTKTLIIHNIGNVYTVGVEAYWDAEKTNRVTDINWGSLYPGNSSTKTLWLYNPGTANVSITKTTNNWNPPEAQNYITLNWNPDVKTLLSGECLQVNLTLTIDTAIADTNITDYSFDIVISATET